VLAQGGTLAFQEFMAGPVQSIIFPMWWGSDDSASFLRTLDEMRDLIESVGFHARVWDQITTNISLIQDPSDSGQTIQTIVMGDDLPAIALANKRNHDERRTVRVRAVFERL